MNTNLNLASLGAMLQPQGQPVPTQPPQMPVAAPPGMQAGNPLQALELMMQIAPQAQSIDDLAMRMASFGPPPSFGPQANQAMQAGPMPAPPPVGMPAQAPPLPPSGNLPRIPQTRGEAQTNPPLGQMLLG
jgi:hypothetical protein